MTIRERWERIKARLPWMERGPGGDALLRLRVKEAEQVAQLMDHPGWAIYQRNIEQQIEDLREQWLRLPARRVMPWLWSGAESIRCQQGILARDEALRTAARIVQAGVMAERALDAAAQAAKRG